MSGHRPRQDDRGGGPVPRAPRRGPARAGLLLRGIAWRLGLSVTVLVVAVVAAAAAATGPAYYASAKQSILADALAVAPVVGQGVGASVQAGPAAIDTLAPLARRARDRSPGGDLLSTLVRGQSFDYAPVTGQTSQVVWRTGLCDHLRMVAGRCPHAAGEYVVSRPLSRADGIGLGDHVHTEAGRGRIVGVYVPVAPSSAYWFAHGYFPQEGQSVPSPVGQVEPVDALLTVRGTFAGLPSHSQLTSVVDVLLARNRVTVARIGQLRGAVEAIQADVTESGGTAVSNIDAALDDAAASSAALVVPVYLITAQLLVLVWLLLFLVITELVQARGPEVALAKLRGLRTVQTVRFGLGEPVVLLLAALPLGVWAGWAATVGLARASLRAGTPVHASALMVGAAALAVCGGLLATVLAARGTLRRGVLDQWRRAERGGVRRGWLPDVALVTLTGAAVLELVVSGKVTSTSTNVLALLVPGLVGIAVAVLVSRLLPLVCRAAFARTRGHGGIGAFLAVRQVARRTAGMRTLIVLAGTFALVTFALSAWSVTRANTADVAGTRVGAAAVLQVQPKPGQDLATTVDRLDRSGTRAMAVSEYDDYGNSSRQTIAVQPRRFAHIAFWRPDFARTDVAALARELAPPAAAPAVLHGDRLRVRVTGVHTSGPLVLQAGVKAQQGFSITPVTLGTLHGGRDATFEVALPGSGSVLRGLSITDRAGGLPAARGRFTIASVQAHGASGWQPVQAGLTDGAGWSWSGGTGLGTHHAITPGPRGLTLSFDLPAFAEASWSVTSFPTPMPALLTSGVGPLPGEHRIRVAGLDGQLLTVTPLARVPVPSAPDGGVIVDRRYALRAAYDSRYTAQDQVWLARSAVADFPAKLRAAGVRVVGEQTSAGVAGQLRSQGPALALSLLLADAAAAAVLAAAGAVIGLHLAGRRRRYELAALIATGASRRALRRGLLLEQWLTLGAGVLAGVGAGLLAAWLALPSVPEFVVTPSAPALLYRPGAVTVAVPLVAVAVVVALAGAASAAALIAGARPEQLREEPS